MRLIFAGTPEFAAVALRALLAADHDVALVLTQPDRPAGRGMKLKPSPVKEVALARGLRVWQPDNLKTEEARAPIADARADAMIVAAYGLILPQSVLDLPRLGCINIHASLLPRWRGAAPIQRAIEAGDAETGITLMRMDKGLDTGAMLARAPLPITGDDTAGSLHDRLAELGARELLALLPALGEGRDRLDRLPDLAVGRLLKASDDALGEPERLRETLAPVLECTLDRAGVQDVDGRRALGRDRPLRRYDVRRVDVGDILRRLSGLTRAQEPHASPAREHDSQSDRRDGDRDDHEQLRAAGAADADAEVAEPEALRI